MAVEHNHYRVAELLVNAGQSKNKDNKTALDLASDETSKLSQNV